MMKKLLRASLIAPMLAASIAIPVLAQNANENQNANANTNATTNDNSNVNANTPTNTNAPTNTNEPRKPKKDRYSAVDGACMSAAVEKRDAAIIAAVDAYAASAKTALTTRKDALKAAWNLTEGRAAAIKAAWKTYRGSITTARKTLRTARQAAWKTFKTDGKACGKGATSADAEGEGADAQL